MADLIRIHSRHISRYNGIVAASFIDTGKENEDTLDITPNTLIYSTLD
jgi:hypothetical protein